MATFRSSYCSYGDLTKFPGGDKEEQPSTFNVVFVHGLFNHPRTTWQTETSPGSPSVYWPRDYLSLDVPQAQAWMYEYNSNRVIDGDHRSLIMTHQGWDLAEDIRRRLKDEIPIVFIAHELGGTLVKQALLKSKSIRERTKFILFLDTPQETFDHAFLASISDHRTLLDRKKSGLGTLEADMNFDIPKYLAEIEKQFSEIRGQIDILALFNRDLHRFSNRSARMRCKITDVHWTQMTRYSTRESYVYTIIRDVLLQIQHNLEGSKSLPVSTADIPDQDNVSSEALVKSTNTAQGQQTMADLENLDGPVHETQRPRKPPTESSHSVRTMSIDDLHNPLIKAQTVAAEVSLQSPTNESSPLLGETIMEGHSGGAIEELEPGVFRIITRGRYGHTFKDVIRTHGQLDAEEYFQHMNEHVDLLKRLSVIPEWLQNLKWIFFPPKASNLANESVENPHKSRGNFWSKAAVKGGKQKRRQNDIESAGGDHEIIPQSQLEVGETLHAEEPGMRAQGPGKSVDPPENVPQEQGQVNEDHYICVSIGRKKAFALHHFRFLLSSDVDILKQDEALFKDLLAFIYKRLRRNFFRQFLFPITFSRVEFWEFKLKDKTLVELPDGWEKILPSDKAPTEQPNGCQGLREPREWCHARELDEGASRYRSYIDGDRLYAYLRSPHTVATNAKGYASRWIPRKCGTKLEPEQNEHIHGWGLVIYEKFDYLSFTLLWSLVALTVAGTIVVVLVISGPLRGNISGICTIMFGFVTMMNVLGFTTALTYAKEQELWPR